MLFSWQVFIVVVIIFFMSSRMLPVLIGLEFLGLLFFSLFFMSFKGFSHDSFVLLFFLVVAVGESVMGLVLFVLITRVVGKDYISYLVSSKF